MRKKYLSALLFGALLVTSAGTFTSCKDYDDDIKNLQEQIDKKASLEELQEQISTMKSDVETAKAEAEEAKQKAEEALQKATENAGGLSQEEVQALIDQAEADIQAQINQLAKLTDVEAKIEALKVELASTYLTEEDLADIKTDITNLWNEIEKVVGKVLNSLVYQPSLYVNGIEATEYAWMQYDQLKSTTATETEFDDNEGVSCVVTSPASDWNYAFDVTKEFNPEIYVDYHVNPSKATIAKENLSLISGDAEVVNTRASESAPKIGTGDIKYENGILSVPVVAIGSKIKGNHTTDGETADLTKASIFALQANVKTSNGEDRVVTSDYASLYSSVITPQAIAYNTTEYNGFDIDAKDCVATNDELWPSVGEALGNVPTIKVAYNSQVDLKTLLELHYNHESLTSNDGEHKVWKWGEEAQYGLKYDFALIQYKAGTNVTEDSKYVDQNLAKTGVIAPRKVEANGATSESTGVSSVGRHPLVRVRVLDSNNKVVLHAYVKLEIVQTVEILETLPFELPDIKFGCATYTGKLTWAQMSNQLLEKTKLSREQFQALYKVDVATDGTTVKQFKKVNGKFVECTAAADIYGTVTETQDYIEGTTTPVLNWELPDEEQQRIYELTDHTKKIYVRYVRRSTNPAETSNEAPVYLPMEVTTLKPEGAVVTKIDEYWYNNSTNTRLNVNYPADGGNTLVYKVDLNQVWKGNKPVFNPTAGFDSYTNTILANQNGTNGGYKYYFADTKDYEVTDLNENKYIIFAGQSGNKVITATGMNGNQYEVTKDNELKYALSTVSGVYKNTSLYAKNVATGTITEIATINQGDGTIQYLNNDVAKLLLNAYHHKEAKLFAQIGVCAYSSCGIALALDGSNYPAYFLRPISMEGNKSGTFIDAQANGSTINIAEVFDFVDWRDEEFKKGTDYSNVWLYAFYNIKAVKVKLADITTTLNGGDIETTKLSSITNKIEINQLDAAGNKVTKGTDGNPVSPVSLNLTRYNAESNGTVATWNAIVEAMGKIKYENNGNNVQGFTLRIPVEFTYDWGTISSYVDVDVKDTMGN